MHYMIAVLNSVTQLSSLLLSVSITSYPKQVDHPYPSLLPGLLVIE